MIAFPSAFTDALALSLVNRIFLIPDTSGSSIFSCFRAFSNTAIIASDFGPYQLDLKNLVQKGGELDLTANAMLVDETKNHKLWAKYIEKLVKNQELIDVLKKNLYDSVHEKYDLRNVTEDRAEFYQKAVEDMKNKMQQ